MQGFRGVRQRGGCRGARLCIPQQLFLLWGAPRGRGLDCGADGNFFHGRQVNDLFDSCGVLWSSVGYIITLLGIYGRGRVQEKMQAVFALTLGMFRTVSRLCETFGCRYAWELSSDSLYTT